MVQEDTKLFKPDNMVAEQSYALEHLELLSDFYCITGIMSSYLHKILMEGSIDFPLCTC